eukprot:1158630-Pelagomonas_calceolata.AAC.2
MAGLLVGVLLDRHYRSLYRAYKARHRHKSKAALTEVPCLEASATGKSSLNAAALMKPCINTAAAEKSSFSAAAVVKPSLDAAALAGAPSVAAAAAAATSATGSSSAASAASAACACGRVGADLPWNPQGVAAVLVDTLPEQKAPRVAMKKYIPYKSLLQDKKRVSIANMCGPYTPRLFRSFPFRGMKLLHSRAQLQLSLKLPCLKLCVSALL